MREFKVKNRGEDIVQTYHDHPHPNRSQLGAGRVKKVKDP
jgi:hypothetical protein